MTCNQLGGACNEEFHASTFEEMAEISKKHGMEMYQKRDNNHMQAMQKMGELMKDQRAMKNWMDKKRKEFETLPDNT